MARPKEFNEEKALDQALDVFWSKGYEATSLGDLTDAMGISKSSFYDTFASKHALFLSSMDRYRATTVKQALAILDGDLPARDAIAAIFDYIVEDKDRRGCFIGNCALEVGSRDTQALLRISGGIENFATVFADTIKRGQSAGEISKTLNPRVVGRFLMS
ncbi:MAG: TetR/AcrR family transcriptional regulator, partial [Alphaproteobacteria bacterium]